MSALLEARAVSVRYPKSDHYALCEASLEIGSGEAVGIVGESGSGKTTLARLLSGALAPTSGRVSVQGHTWAEIGRRDQARQRIQMIFQDPYGALNPWLTPLKTVAEVIANWERVRRVEAERRATEILAEVGLEGEVIRRLPRRLSGGQCQRVGIARALAADPGVLIADEPTSSLDVSVQGQILNLLSELRARRQLTLLLISHDLEIVRFATDWALVMYGGQVVERGPTASLLATPCHPYTQILIDSIPGREGEAEMQVNAGLDDAIGCVFARRCPLAGHDCLQSRPKLRSEGEHAVACIREHPEVRRHKRQTEDAR